MFKKIFIVKRKFLIWESAYISTTSNMPPAYSLNVLKVCHGLCRWRHVDAWKSLELAVMLQPIINTVMWLMS